MTCPINVDMQPLSCEIQNTPLSRPVSINLSTRDQPHPLIEDQSAKAIFQDKPYITLENPDEREFAQNDPKRFLARFQNGAILKTHASRGALFETWVVSELYKQCLNAGQPTDLYFWRDSSGNEIDLIKESANGLQPMGKDIAQATLNIC